MSARRLLAVAAAGLVAGLVSTLTSLVAGPGALAAHAAQAETLTSRIVITSLTPTLVQQDDTVHVTGRITNQGKTAIEQVSVRMRAVGGRLGTRDDVDTWLDGRDPREGVPVNPTVELEAPLAAGKSATFTLDVPAQALGLRGGPFGVYPIAFDARGTDAEGARDQVAFLRGTVQWQPPAREYVKQQIGWLVPFTGLPGPTANAVPTMEQVQRALAPGRRLPRLLEAASAPGVAWAVDPALLATLREAADGTLPSTSATSGTATPTTPTTPTPTTPTPSTPTSSPTSTPTTSTGTPSTYPSPNTSSHPARAAAAEFLARMRAAAADREVIELPYSDPDLQILSNASAMQLVTAARAAGAGTINELLGVTPRVDIGWTPDGYATDQLIGDLAGQDVTQLVLDERSRPLVDALSYTPDAMTQSLPAGATAVLWDAQLSRLATTSSSRDAAATDRFLAETAAATSERPGLARRMLVSVPPTAVLDPAAFKALVRKASTVPWLSVTTVASMFEPPPARADASQLARRQVDPPPTVANEGITTQDVGVALGLRAQLAALGEVVAEPAQLTAALQRSTLDLVSAVWRGHRKPLASRQQASTQAVHQVTSKISVLKTTITFLRSSGELQLTIRNDLRLKASNLRLRVIAPSPRLVVSQEVSEPIDVAPGTRTSVRVPVRALASGQVALQAQLIAPSGGAVGDPVAVQVHVRPTDTWAFSVLGVIVGLVLLVGLVRALRRPRRRSGLADVPDEGEAL